MAPRDLNLYEMIRVVRQNLHEATLFDDEDLGIPEAIAAQFITRLRVNPFDIIVTAWIPSSRR
jgi:hypothetical protein